MNRIITIKICQPVTIPEPYPMAGRTFENFVVQGFTDGKKTFGGVLHSAAGVADWLVEYLKIVNV